MEAMVFESGRKSTRRSPPFTRQGPSCRRAGTPDCEAIPHPVPKDISRMTAEPSVEAVAGKRIESQLTDQKKIKIRGYVAEGRAGTCHLYSGSFHHGAP